MTEYIIMFVSHIFKTAEYFIAEGLPIVSLDLIPEAAEALFFQLSKIITIYLSMG